MSLICSSFPVLFWFRRILVLVLVESTYIFVYVLAMLVLVRTAGAGRNTCTEAREQGARRETIRAGVDRQIRHRARGGGQMGSTGVRRRAGGPKRHIASAQMSGDQREAVPACRWCNHREAVQSRPRQPADQRLALSISACSIPGVYSLSLALIQSTFGPVYTAAKTLTRQEPAG